MWAAESTVADFIQSWCETERALSMEAKDFPSGPVVQNLPANAGVTGSIPGPRRLHILRNN